MKTRISLTRDFKGGGEIILSVRIDTKNLEGKLEILKVRVCLINGKKALVNCRLRGQT